jgi:hypothetical protein
MASDRFVIEEEETYREPSKAAGCFKGCLIASGILCVVLLLIVFWVSRNWQRWAADFGSDVLNEVINESDLPALEKDEVKQQVGRLAGAVREGDLTGEQLRLVMDQILESPLMTSLVVAGIEKKYIEPSGLAEAEKEAGRVALRRFVRGLISQQFSDKDLEEAMSTIATKQPNGQWELPDSATDDQLRALLQLVKDKSDAAQIPAEVEEFDPSDEMRRIIDSALDERPVTL